MTTSNRPDLAPFVFSWCVPPTAHYRHPSLATNPLLVPKKRHEGHNQHISVLNCPYQSVPVCTFRKPETEVNFARVEGRCKKTLSGRLSTGRLLASNERGLLGRTGPSRYY